MGKKVPGGKAFREKKVAESKPQSTINSCPIWRFDKLDRDGPFSFDLSRPDFKHREVLEKLMKYGNMTWAEIDGQTHDRKSKHHFLSEQKLSPKAWQRIRAKHLEEETDAIFSFALQNKLRIIGIREQGEFHIVWYDPEHEFCPRQTG